MTPRQRVLTALELGTPDRVPFVDLDVADNIASILTGKEDPAPEEVAAALHMDALVPFRGYAEVYGEFHTDENGRQAYVDGQIKSRDDLSRVALTPPHEKIADLKRYVDAHGNSGYALIASINLNFDAVVFSMGYEAFSLALYDDPGLVEELFRIYTDWTCEFCEALPETGVDVLWTTDDFAFKTGPFISPALFREKILPFMREVANVITVPWIMHSDGNCSSFFDDLVSLGINAFHPFEPGAMDIEQYKVTHGDRIALCGNIDLHHTLTKGTPEEVREEVRRRIEVCGKNGGYLLASGNSIADYCLPENVKAMGDAVEEFAYY